MKIYALASDPTVEFAPCFEAREDAEAYITEQGSEATVVECDLVPKAFRQEARPFICFPLDESTEGWIQVAADLQEMMTYMIEEKVEKVEVKYIDRRLGGEIESPRDYGLAIALQRDKYPNSDFFKQLLKESGNNEEPH